MPLGPCAAAPTSLRLSLDLSHREPLSDDSLGQALLATRVLQRHERPCVAGRELASGNEMLDSNRELQQAQGVGDVSAGLAERARKASDRTVTTPAVADAQSLEVRLELARLLNRVGAPCSARQRQDRLGFLVGDVVADVDRDLPPPGALRGESCLDVGQNLVARAVWTNHDRIDRTVRLDETLQRDRYLGQGPPRARGAEIELFDACPVGHRATPVSRVVEEFRHSCHVTPHS